MSKTADEALAKLETLVTPKPCSACGHDRWRPLDGVVMPPVVTGKAPVITEGLPCIALLCTRCGFVRYHATEMLKD